MSNEKILAKLNQLTEENASLKKEMATRYLSRLRCNTATDSITLQLLQVVRTGRATEGGPDAIAKPPDAQRV